MRINRRELGLLTLGATAAALVGGCDDDKATQSTGESDPEQTILGMLGRAPQTTDVALGIGLWSKAAEQAGFDLLGGDATDAQLGTLYKSLNRFAVFQGQTAPILIGNGTHMRSTDGWDYGDLTGLLEVANDGSPYTVYVGSFDRDRIDHASPRSADGHRVAVPDDSTLLYASDDATLEALRDVEAKSLADNEMVAALAGVLDAAAVHSALFDRTFAAGSSYVDGKSRTTLVLYDADKAVPKRIEAALATGRDEAGLTWPSGYAVRGIGREGRVTVIQLKGNEPGRWMDFIQARLLDSVS